MDRLNSEQLFHDRQAHARAGWFMQHPDQLRFTDHAYLDHETWIRPAFRQLGDVRGLRVLDYGCGHGMAAVVLSRAGAQVTAFDLSHGYVAEAAARARVNGVVVKLLQASTASGAARFSITSIWQSPPPSCAACCAPAAWRSSANRGARTRCSAGRGGEYPTPARNAHRMNSHCAGGMSGCCDVCFRRSSCGAINCWGWRGACCRRDGWWRDWSGAIRCCWSGCRACGSCAVMWFLRCVGERIMATLRRRCGTILR